MKNIFVCALVIMFLGMQPMCRAMATKEEIGQIDACILKNKIYEKEQREREVIQGVLGGSVFLALGLTAAQRAFDSSRIYKHATSQPQTNLLRPDLLRLALRSSRMGRILVTTNLERLV